MVMEDEYFGPAKLAPKWSCFKLSLLMHAGKLLTLGWKSITIPISRELQTRIMYIRLIIIFRFTNVCMYCNIIRYYIILNYVPVIYYRQTRPYIANINFRNLPEKQHTFINTPHTTPRNR